MIVKLTVLLILGCVADLGLRRATAALRHLIWSLTLTGALLLPVGGLYVPRIAGPAFVIHTSAKTAVLMETPAKFNWLMAIYAAGVALLLLRLALDILAANRLVRDARPGSLPGVLVSGNATVPFAWGSIVIPEGLPVSDAVLAHERAHIERGDVWMSVLARVACAIYWFHPLVWWAAARMRLEADRACDDAVLRSGFGEAGYAENLVEIARSFGPSTLAPGAVKRSQLEVRVLHILSGTVDRRKLGAAAACIAVLASIAVIAPLTALSQQSFAGIGTVYRVGNGVKAPSVLSKVDPQYTEEARAAKIAGTALLSVVVCSDGLARNIHVIRSLEPGLDANAVLAVEQWTFKPGMKDGEPVNVQATIEVNFRLEKKKEGQ